MLTGVCDRLPRSIPQPLEQAKGDTNSVRPSKYPQISIDVKHNVYSNFPQLARLYIQRELKHLNSSNGFSV